MRTAPYGFTLLELLVALAVFAIMAIAAYSGLRHVLFTHAAIETENRQLAILQLAVFRLEQDIQQSLARSIRDEYGERQPALQGGGLNNVTLTLTRTGWDNPLGQHRSNLQRVAYQLTGKQLWRLHWPVLDRGSLIEPSQTLLLDQVLEFRVRFLAQTGNAWRSDWPPPAASDTAQIAPDRLPRAVELTLILEDWGEITRLLLLPH
ncbi:MAG: type II secretion system protein GspJ [Candidatus Contendobacter odensis]|uniref:Type II secretion system protein J n=1 Tax=Candidatus Contendibacter odensensis TaxID=1400860 RepID=A0A2G6PFR6_9GAMM|nr:MAG: type II secretion system protein GspJ [Candidatus Contendobacter odensis]